MANNVIQKMKEEEAARREAIKASSRKGDQNHEYRMAKLAQQSASKNLKTATDGQVKLAQTEVDSELAKQGIVRSRASLLGGLVGEDLVKSTGSLVEDVGKGVRENTSEIAAIAATAANPSAAGAIVQTASATKSTPKPPPEEKRKALPPSSSDIIETQFKKADEDKEEKSADTVKKLSSF